MKNSKLFISVFSRIFIFLIVCTLTGLCVWFFLSKEFVLRDISNQLITSRADIKNLPYVPHIPDRVCDIRRYGANTDDNQSVTSAINAAIADCAGKGGGVVYVPKGRWLSGPVKLQSNINLFLAEESEIVFSTNLQDYLPVVFTRFQGIEFYNYSPLIYIKDGHDIAITGKGKLIGNGDARENWTGGGNFEMAREKLHNMSLLGTPLEERIFGDQEPGLRPAFIQFVNCKNILLDGFVVENGPIWTIHPIYSENFVARNLTINTWSGNTDGIVIDSTKSVVIEDSFFSTGDDAISIKSGLDEDGRRVAKSSENIRIRNITVTKGSSGVSIGSEMSGGVRDVDIRDSSFTNTRHGFRIKSTRTRGGFIENINVENIIMDKMSGDAIDINLTYSSELQSDVSHKPTLKNILIKDIRGKENERLAINMDGISNSIMEEFRIENVSFASSSRAVSLKNVRNVSLQNIYIETESNPIYEIENSQNITVNGSVCREGANPCFLIGGTKTKNILLKKIDFSNALKFIDVVDGASRQSILIKDE